MSDALLGSASAILADLRARRVSAVEQLMAHIARHEAQHGRLNAVIATDIDRARADAQGIDDARARGEALGPLAGLPMTIKDTFDVAGMPAVVGNPHYRGRDKDCADADVVAAVRAAGAVIWGKTNVPFMAADVQTDNAVYGRTNNPHDVTRTPGGSSGGPAAALAAGITPLEIGSDIAGSLRTPGNFCGVVALKTTYGALSSLGHIPPAPGVTLNSDLGVVGPMARTTRDVRLLFAVLSGAPATPRRPVQGLRIAVWDEGLPVSAEVLAGVARAAEALAAQGVHVARIAPPLPLDALLDSYFAMLFAITTADLPDRVAAQLGAHAADDDAALAAGADRHSVAFFRRAATSTYRAYSEAMAVRDGLKHDLAAFFDAGWDALLAPVGPVVAFPHDTAAQQSARRVECDGRAIPYTRLFEWIGLATSLHVPALAVPAGRSADRLPTGVQLIAPWKQEDRLLDLGEALDDAFGFAPPPTG